MGSDWEETCEMMGWGINDDIDWGDYEKEELSPYDRAWSTLEDVKKFSMENPGLWFVRKQFDDSNYYYIVKE